MLLLVLHYMLPVQERRGMRDMYRLCATERLFIPDMFPDMEKAIFMDTDLIFLRCSMCVVGGAM